jgi:hypothetical protein
MTSDELLTRIRTRQPADLHAYFPGLAERDLMQILCATPEHAIYILQQRFGCDVEAAKAAWNDYVLRFCRRPTMQSLTRSQPNNSTS